MAPQQAWPKVGLCKIALPLIDLTEFTTGADYIHTAELVNMGYSSQTYLRAMGPGNAHIRKVTPLAQDASRFGSFTYSVNTAMSAGVIPLIRPA